MKNLHTKIARAILKKTVEDKDYVIQDFFVGLTDDPKKRLFLEHKVDEDDGLYVYYKAGSTEEAMEAFDELFKLDMNGAPSVKKNKKGQYVYCYHINGITVECPTRN